MTVDELNREIENIRIQLVEKYLPEQIVYLGPGADDVDSCCNTFLIVKSNVPYLGVERLRDLDRVVERNVAVIFLVLKPEELKDRIGHGDPLIARIMNRGRVLHG